MALVFFGPQKLSEKVNNELMLRWLFILPIRFYQYAISPLIGPRCRFQPTCSHYAIEAIQEWGVLKGSWLALKRIVKCHPWGSWGYDPVPKRGKKDDGLLKK